MLHFAPEDFANAMFCKIDLTRTDAQRLNHLRNAPPLHDVAVEYLVVSRIRLLFHLGKCHAQEVALPFLIPN